MKITTLLLMLGLPLAAEPPLTVTVAGVVHLVCSTAPNAVNEWQPCTGPITLTIPAGPKGDTGLQGPAGPQGTPGAQGTTAPNNYTGPSSEYEKRKNWFQYTSADRLETSSINLDNVTKTVLTLVNGIPTITVYGAETIVITGPDATRLNARLNELGN